MQMDTRIPLMGQQPDFVNTLARSTQAAQLANQNRDQNALRQLFQTQGPQIMAGEGNALNALAQIDPNAALGIQGARQDMTVQRERLGLAREASAREAARYAMDLEEGQRKQFKEATRALVGMLSVAQTPEQFEQAKQRAAAQYPGFDTSQYTFDDLPMVVAELEGAAAGFDLIERRNPAQKPADEYQRYFQEEAQAGRKPLTRIEFEQAKKGTEIIYGPDGNPIVQRGPGSTKPFTEGQSKDNVYSTRARGALDALEPVADALISRGERAAEYVPFGFGRDFQSDEFQVAQQAGTEFLQAILRKDTGAAITQQEVDSYGQVYLPQPGDGGAVLEAKRAARIRAINALESGMTSAQMLARDSALVKAAREGGQVRRDEATGGDQTPEQAPEFLSPEDADLWQYMTPLERKAVLGEYEAKK